MPGLNSEHSLDLLDKSTLCLERCLPPLTFVVRDTVSLKLQNYLLLLKDNHLKNNFYREKMFLLWVSSLH